MSQAHRPLINYSFIDSMEKISFDNAEPFPWSDYDGLLTEDGYACLIESFPNLDHFVRHVDQPRRYGQRPHNRYYLAYDGSVDHPQHEKKGVIPPADLPANWRHFIAELEGERYRSWIMRLLGVSNVKFRFCWHAGFAGGEVSPHRDDEMKIGTHIFYFVNSEDWDPLWGGQTVLLSGKRVRRLNPDFDDFETATMVRPFTGNHSFLFKNTSTAWHGVRALACPEGTYRRIFSVVIEWPDWPRRFRSRVTRKIRSAVFG